MSGFLPSSLFQRLICKAVNWSQLTTVEKSSSSEFSLLEVYKDVAVLRYGSQKFQLTNLVDKNCIRVDVEGLDPNPIYQRLRKQLEVLIEECMHSLRFVTTLLISTALDEVKLNPVVPSSPAPSNNSPRAGTNASPGPTNNSSSSDNSNSNSNSSNNNNNSSSKKRRSSDECHIILAEAIKTFTTPGYVVESIDKRLLISENILKAQHRLIPDSADRRSSLFLSHRL